MGTIVPYAIWLSIILVSLGIIAIVVFGIRNLGYGKINPLSAVAIAVPLVLFALLGLIIGEWDLAAIWTVVIMLIVTVLALFLSGVRGLSGF